jgi:MFS family permease
MIFGLLFLLAFVQWERHTKTPMLPLDFFKKRTFSTGSVAMFMNAFSLFGTGYFFSQYFQSIIGYSPLIASLAMSPQLVIQYFATLNSVNVVKKIGTKWTIAMGLFVAGIGVFIFTQMTQVNTPYPILIIPLVIMGIGMGNIMTPVMTSTLSSLPPERSGIGSAVADTFLNVGGALGFALNGAIMNRFYRLQIMENIPGLGLSDSTFAMILSSVQNALVAAKEMTADLANQVIFTAKESFVHGMDIALIVISGTLMVTCLFVLFTVPVSIETENKVE